MSRMRAMFKQLGLADWITICVVMAMLAALIYPASVGVWSGHFELTIAVEENALVDRDSLKFATGGGIPAGRPRRANAH